MSEILRPASSSARLAAWAFKPRPVMCATRPISDSPTPTMATLFFNDATGFMARFSRRNALELREHGALPTVFEVHLHPIADLHAQRIFAEDVRDHARTLVEFDEGDDIGRERRECGQWSAPHDRVAVNGARARARHPFKLIGPAFG